MGLHEVTIKLPISEIHTTGLAVAQFVSPDERGPFGHVLLSSDGSQRTWRAIGPDVTLAVDGGVDAGVYELFVPPRLLQSTALAAGGNDTVTISTGTDRGRPVLTASGPGGLFNVGTHDGSFITDDVSARDQVPVGLMAIAGAAEFRELVAMARQRPAGFDGDAWDWPPFELSVDDGWLEACVDWGAFGVARCAIPADVDGRARATVRPNLLAALLEIYPEEEICIGFPAAPLGPLALSWQGWDAGILQVDSTGEPLLARVERILAGVLGWGAATQDADDTYRLVADPRVDARLMSDRPARLQIRSVLVEGVPPTTDLITELNDHNRHLGFARVTWQDGSVVAEVDLVAETLQPLDIRTAVERARNASIELGPLLAAVYGGIAATSGDTRR